MATNTTRILVLETQMAAIKQQINSRHRDLKAAIAALAASTKASIDALTDSLEQRREDSTVCSPWHATPNQFADLQQFSLPPRRSLILDPHVWVPSSTVSGQPALIADHQVPSPTFNWVSPLSNPTPTSLIPSVVFSSGIQDPNHSFPPPLAPLPSPSTVVVYPIDSCAYSPVGSSTSEPSNLLDNSPLLEKTSTPQIHSFLSPAIHTSSTGDPNVLCARKFQLSFTLVFGSTGTSCNTFSIGVFFPAMYDAEFWYCHTQLRDSEWDYGVQLCHGYCGNCVVSTGRGNCPCFKEPYKDYCYAYTPPVKKPELPKPYLGLKFFTLGEMYRRRGVKIPGGILLCGSPSVGKTQLSKVVAGEAGVTFFSTSASQVVEICIGVGASRVRSLNQEARENAPSLVFIEGLDVVGRERGLINGSGGQERNATLNQLLVCLEGFEGRGDVITIAATNRQDILDPALVRPGRIDRKIYIPRPGRIACMEILKVHASKKPMAEDVDYMAVASMTDGMVGVELANIIEVAAINMMRDGRNEITTDDFLQAAQIEERGMLDRKDRSTKTWKKVAINEAAMAVVSLTFLDFRDIEFATISPRAGLAGLINTCRMVSQHPLSCQFAAVSLWSLIRVPPFLLRSWFHHSYTCWAVEERVVTQQPRVQFLTHNIAKSQYKQKIRACFAGWGLGLPSSTTLSTEVCGWKTRYFGPFKVLSKLKLCRSIVPPATLHLPAADDNGSLKLAPARILALRFVNQDNRDVTQVLVQ
ncbi:unnamed protein product [Linum trigynum]|uniref:AAA+ ATPase domain-containing protein n=1 Tax=Linum trigynum TaxID=586398 RepID=A0AAV2E6C3_9ROSI